MSQSDRDTLEEIFSQQNQRDYPGTPPDKYFEIFSADQILKARGYDLDAEQIASGIVGGGDDGGVDSFFVFINTRLLREDTDRSAFRDQQLDFDVVIIQSKNKASFEEVPLTKLLDFSENCLRLGSNLSTVSSTLYNQSLLDAVGRFHGIYRDSLLKRPTLKISYYYASFGEQIHPKVEERARLLQAKANEIYSAATCDVEFAGANKLLKWFYDTPSNTNRLITKKHFYSGQFGKAYVCIVTLENFASFLTLNGVIRNYMFEANVRDYQGSATVNKSIAQTLSHPGSEEFWWLNNGVTILSTEAQLDGDDISVTNPLIVNGLQTSYEIFNQSQRGGFSNDSRMLLVRVIETSNLQSIDNIINATNSQTKIPRLWLHATEPIHRKIESILGRVNLYYDRRKNYHRNQGVPITEIITIPFMAQSLAAIVLQRPDDARARPTTVTDKYYGKMFSDRFPIMLYSTCALIIRRIKNFLDTTEMSNAEKHDLLFYLAMYATCTTTRSAVPSRPKIANVDISLFTDALLLDCLALILDQYQRLGGDDRVAKGPQLVSSLKAHIQNQFARRRNIL